MYKKVVVIVLFIVMLLIIPSVSFSLTLVRVGYIDLDNIIKTYTLKYLTVETEIRQKYVNELQQKYNDNYYTMTVDEINSLQLEIEDQSDVLTLFQNNKFYWISNGQIIDTIINQIVQRDIMKAIKKTGEFEGFNLILDNTGNFVYGSDDINLTDKVLFRLDARLLDIQNNPPRVPLSLELEGENTEQDKNVPAPPNSNSTDNN